MSPESLESGEIPSTVRKSSLGGIDVCNQINFEDAENTFSRTSSKSKNEKKTPKLSITGKNFMDGIFQKNKKSKKKKHLIQQKKPLVEISTETITIQSQTPAKVP